MRSCEMCDGEPCIHCWQAEAEAARAEAERLRAKGLDDFTVTGEEFDRALAEIQRLREALQVIWDDAKLDALDMRQVAREALGEQA